MSFWNRIHDIANSLDATSYYALLGVAPDSPGPTIIDRYYELAAKLHPDRFAQASSEQTNALSRIHARLNEAKRILSNPKSRERYDLQLNQGKVRMERGSENIPKSYAGPTHAVAAKLFEEGLALKRSGNKDGARTQFLMAKRYEEHASIIRELDALEGASNEAEPAPPQSNPPASSALDNFLGSSDDEEEEEETPAPIPPSQGGAENRQTERQKTSLPIRVNVKSNKDFRLLYSRNISRGGMFIVSDRPQPKGSDIDIELLTPSGESVNLTGTVVHVRQEKSGRASGMGIRFKDSKEVAATVEQLLAALDAPLEMTTPSSLEELVTTMLRLKDLQPHEVLGIPQDASVQMAGEAYGALARQYHPSRNSANDPVLTDAYKEVLLVIRKAFETFGS